jgi:hypothetical protein
MPNKERNSLSEITFIVVNFVICREKGYRGNFKDFNNGLKTFNQNDK